MTADPSGMQEPEPVLLCFIISLIRTTQVHNEKLAVFRDTCQFADAGVTGSAQSCQVGEVVENTEDPRSCLVGVFHAINALEHQGLVWFQTLLEGNDFRFPSLIAGQAYGVTVGVLLLAG